MLKLEWKHVIIAKCLSPITNVLDCLCNDYF